ncbi:hypothetical protein KFL_000140430 [Klebsormidium nitens]|uniref:Uncharacterized protein n=1 Tax=Klebsormidium nitens TaxID=105231 RepID=A0A1Y1HKP0_KLENI|nr:hypothetical protein KFL_000140430 [Klebsormidium nitens]|eukprot:GAQ78523.1 hypothetical protein KFL_000140430 [Klebsormidium nitens]
MCGMQSCNASTPATSVLFKQGLRNGCTWARKCGLVFRRHLCEGQGQLSGPKLRPAPRSGVFAQQGKESDRQRQAASANEGASRSDAIGEQGSLGSQTDSSQSASSQEDQATDGPSAGQLRALEQAMQQAQRQLDLFTEQLQEYAEFDSFDPKFDQDPNPENLSSLGPGRGLWQAPSFSLGVGQGQDVPPELMEMLAGGEGEGAEESIFPEDRYFEEVSKEELKEILYGNGGFEKSFRGEREAAADFEHWGELWEGSAQSSGRGASNERALSRGVPQSEGLERGDISRDLKANVSRPGEAEAAAPRQDGQKATSTATAIPSSGSETSTPGIKPSPNNGVPVPPLPPPRVLQARIPPPPSPQPNLLPVSPLQRPSSWLSDSYPPRQGFLLPPADPPKLAPRTTPHHSPPPRHSPHPPAAPVYPLTGAPLQGASEQVPWPPVPPPPGSDNSFRPPLDQRKVPTPGPASVADSGFLRSSLSGKPLTSDRVPRPEGSSLSDRSPLSSSDWTSSPDRASFLEGPPYLDGPSPSDITPYPNGTVQSDGSGDPDAQSVRFRETPQLQSEALRRLFAMSPEELRALDRQLATGGAQLQVTGGAALDLGALGAQNGPTTNPPEKEPIPQQSTSSAADVTAEVSKERPTSNGHKARTLDDIIDELSSVTGDQKFADLDSSAPGGGSVGDLLDRLKRLVDISEKAIGDLAFGGALPEEKEGNGDDDDSLPWYEEPGTCMDDEYYGGSREPRKGTENVANLFADPVLAEKRFSRPLGYGERFTEDGVESGDVASREEGESASPDVTLTSAEGPGASRGGQERNGVHSGGGLGPEAAAVLGVRLGKQDNVSDSEAGSKGQSASGAGLSQNQTVSTAGGTFSDASSSPNAAGSSDDLRDASIESMAASLGMFQDAGPDSKVSTFEAPRAGRGPESSSQGGAGSPESGGVEESSSGGGWLGQKVARVGLDVGLGLEEAVKRAVNEHTGPESRAKKGASRGGGISKAMAETLEASKKGRGGEEMAGKGRKGKSRKGAPAKEEVKAKGDLVETESAGSDLGGSGASKKLPGKARESVTVGRDLAVSDALFGTRTSAASGRPANSFLNQAIAAQREGGLTPPKSLASANLEEGSEAEAIEKSSESDQQAKFDRLPAAESLSTAPNPGQPKSADALSESDQPLISAETSRNPDQTGLADESWNPSSPPNPSNPEASEPFKPDSVADLSSPESTRTPNGQSAQKPPRKKGDYPDWMPKFLDHLHPDSPNFDPEAYAKTHPIKRAMMDDDAAGRFPDFSLEALATPAPELARLPEEETNAPEHSFEDHPANRVNEALNISEEQRGRVLEAANAADFDPAAYDKSAPPWEAFRGFGTGSRDMEGWDAEGQVNLPEGEQEFEIRTKEGGTRKVTIPADGFKNEQELIDTFGDFGTYPYMADNFEAVADDDILQEVPPPDIPPEDKAMQLKVEDLAYSLRDFLAMDRDPEADPFKKGLVNSFVTFEDPLHCFTSATLLEEWLNLFARNGYPPSLDFIWYEADPAHRWTRWVYTTMTITLPKDLKKQLEDWGAQGWYEAEFGDGPEPEPEQPEQRNQPRDEAFRKVLRKAGVEPMKEKEKPLVLEMFSKFEMDEAGKITSVYSTWEDFEEEDEPSTPRMRAKRRLFMAALLRKEWGR